MRNIKAKCTILPSSALPYIDANITDMELYGEIINRNTQPQVRLYIEDSAIYPLKVGENKKEFEVEQIFEKGIRLKIVAGDIIRFGFSTFLVKEIIN